LLSKCEDFDGHVSAALEEDAAAAIRERRNGSTGFNMT
jgi:hypothetical protein